MTVKIAIIGDRFMLPEVFQREIESLIETRLDIRCMSNDWPDEPVEHGYATEHATCLLYTSPSPRDRQKSRMPSSA